ncbi:uncharacterized protein LOC118348611 [Juglans regia]|uniref:Uncharacterized protein LOC118348611 n=1 Tax=Juglans regia TaxID=51240 RepID=A0A6P9EVC2_JUGRE|nr:uncharacterized protein LOC118348611 [Juglans regia]
MNGPLVASGTGGLDKILVGPPLVGLEFLAGNENGKRRTFAEVLQRPIPPPKFKLSVRHPEVINGELGFIFSDLEMEKAAEDLKFALVLKFLSSRPSIDVLRKNIIKTWGFSEVPMISFMNDFHVLLHLANEKDYLHAWAREGRVVAGVPFRLFNWSMGFDLEREPSIEEQWIFLPGLPLHLYRLDCLQSFATRFGNFLGTDNATVYRTRATGARLCVAVDLRDKQIKGFPVMFGSHQIWQLVVYEKLGFYCNKCYRQGHTEVACRMGQRASRVLVGKQSRNGEGNKDDGKIWKEVGQKNSAVVITKEDDHAKINLELQPDKPESSNAGEKTKEGAEVSVKVIKSLVTGSKEGECVSGLGASSPLCSDENIQPSDLMENHLAVCVVQQEPGINLLVEDFAAGKLREDATAVTHMDAGQQLNDISAQDSEDDCEEVWCDSVPQVQADGEKVQEDLPSSEGWAFLEGGELWVFWNIPNIFEIVLCMTQSVSGWFKWDAHHVLVTFVYAKCSYVDRRELWHDLEEWTDLDQPWLVLGDFNVIRRDLERVGGNPRPFISMLEFNDYIDHCGLLEEAWNQQDTVSGLLKLSIRLKRTKIALRAWNKNVFGRVDVNIRALEERLDFLDSQLQSCFSEEIEDDFVATKTEIEIWEKREASRLGQIAKKKWLTEGDQNSKFFHSVINQRRNKGHISKMVLADGRVLCTAEEVHEEAVDYFRNFLSDVSTVEHCDLSRLIEKKISDEENLWLCAAPSELEVKQAVFSIPKNSSPGPDGFGSGFYMSCWDIIKEDVVAATGDFFRGVPLSRFYSPSFIVLIPKVPEPSGAFIPGRSIFENITLAQEMVQSLHKKFVGGNVLIKLNMAKVYDRSQWFSVMMNGTLKGFFQSARGLRQGDPLSPYLFILMEEVLSRLLRSNFQDGRIGKFSHPIGAPLVSLLLYADDILIFTNGGKREGGLGMKDLKEVQKSLHMKFAFRILSSNNLWSDFFRAKYIRHSHFSTYKVKPTDSRFWRSIVKMLPEVMDNVNVLVRGGNASFWFDRWLASGPLSIRVEEITNNRLRLQDCWSNNFWDEDLLRELVSEEVVEEIIQMPINVTQGLDLFVWKPSTDGRFSTRTAWEVVRKRGQELPWHDWFWHQLLPRLGNSRMDYNQGFETRLPTCRLRAFKD